MKKTILASILVLALICLSAAGLAETVKTPASDGSLNVRSGPGTGYKVVTWVKNGQAITVLENTSPWSKIKVNSTGKTGYIKAKYISGGSAQPSSGTLGTVTTRFAGSVVNVRKGPGTDSAVSFKLASGARVHIHSESGNWYLIQADNGKTGYISRNYVTVGTRKTTTAAVNLRAGAGTGYDKIAVVYKGTPVTAISVSGNWTRVTANGQTGYIYSAYLK